MTASPRPGAGRTALFLLGAPGSGLAAFGRVLEATGAAPPADPAAVAALSERALLQAGSGPLDPFGPRRRPGAEGEADPARVEEARALLRTADPHAPLLLLADPRQTRTADLWRAALDADGWRTRFVLLVRAPGEAAAAAQAEGVPGRNRAMLLWTSCMLEAERAARGGRRAAVGFDRLLADPERELDRLERALDLRLPRRTWDSAAEIEALLAREPRPAPTALPEALAPVRAFHVHLEAAAVDEPQNVDAAAETARWFAALAELMAPVARAGSGTSAGRADPAASAQDGADVRRAEAAVLETARREAREAAERAEQAEAQATILRSALAVARRRAGEAETLLQARAAEASAGEREARAALAAAVAGREAAETASTAARTGLERARGDLAEARAGLDEARRRAEERDGRLRAEEQRHRAELEAAQARLHAFAGERDQLAQEGDAERARHGETRERLALAGVAGLAAQARVRELEARLADVQGELERRRRWLPRLFGLR